MNTHPIPLQTYKSLLGSFPESFRDKLRIYTYEELYYISRILEHKMQYDHLGNVKTGDLFFSTLKTQLLRWLKGELDAFYRPYKPVSPLALEKLASRYKFAYRQLLEASIEAEHIAMLKQKFKGAA